MWKHTDRCRLPAETAPRAARIRQQARSTDLPSIMPSGQQTPCWCEGRSRCSPLRAPAPSIAKPSSLVVVGEEVKVVNGPLLQKTDTSLLASLTPLLMVWPMRMNVTHTCQEKRADASAAPHRSVKWQNAVAVCTSETAGLNCQPSSPICCEPWRERRRAPSPFSLPRGFRGSGTRHPSRRDQAWSCA